MSACDPARALKDEWIWILSGLEVLLAPPFFGG
jgi:hypothetical protein